jgi:glucose-6-phosphate 1-epimerase
MMPNSTAQQDAQQDTQDTQPYAQQLTAEGVSFRMQDNIMMIEVKNGLASALITTHGGSVLNFKPSDQPEVLWVSPTSIYNGQKPVRGGVPICWPWFGANATNPAAPAHGFVRNAVWQLEHVANMPTGVTEVVLGFDSSEETLALWPHYFHAELKIEVGEKLALSLTTYNLNDHDIEITEAFHTYFAVADARDLVIAGLDGATHLDKLTHKPAEVQAGNLVLKPPMDSVYLNHTADTVIEDVGNQRAIVIEKQGAQSAVVWNPGPETVKGFGDIPDDLWPAFVCVEAGNIADNAVVIGANEKHTFTMMLSSQAR